MNLVDFITWVKRESRYGGAPVITGAAAANDQPTIDILRALNARRKRIWRKPGNWRWFVEPIQFQVTPPQSIYVVKSKSGNRIDRIQDLWPIDLTTTPNNYGLPFKQRTPRQFAQDMVGGIVPQGYTGNYGITPSGYSGIYKNLGLDANGNWNIEIGLGPSSAFTMGGEAKGVLNTFLIGDVTGIPPFSAGNIAGVINPPLDYFPDGVVEDVLFEGVMGDIDLIQGDKAGYAAAETAFEGKTKLLAAEETDAAKDNTPITRPLPRLVQRRLNRRFRSW